MSSKAKTTKGKSAKPTSKTSQSMDLSAGDDKKLGADLAAKKTGTSALKKRTSVIKELDSDAESARGGDSSRFVKSPKNSEE